MDLGSILEAIYLVNALIILFYSILWVLGTKDRKRILSLLHDLIEILQGQNGGTPTPLGRRGEKEEGGESV